MPDRHPIDLILFLILMLGAPFAGAKDVYQEPEAFLAESFNGTAPEPRVLWLKKELKAQAAAILGHQPDALRVRYWREAERSAWILEEIGKERPITVGIVVNAGKIERLRVLIYRESRGWEVRHGFFTDQFQGAALDDKNALTQSIDGISGATLSVRALTRLARLALYYHQQTDAVDDTH